MALVKCVPRRRWSMVSTPRQILIKSVRLMCSAYAMDSASWILQNVFRTFETVPFMRFPWSSKVQGSQLRLPILAGKCLLNSTRFAGKFLLACVNILRAAAAVPERTPCRFSTKALAMAIVLNPIFWRTLVNRTKFCSMKINCTLCVRNWPQSREPAATEPGVHLTFSGRFTVNWNSRSFPFSSAECYNSQSMTK